MVKTNFKYNDVFLTKFNELINIQCRESNN